VASALLLAWAVASLFVLPGCAATGVIRGRIGLSIPSRRLASGRSGHRAGAGFRGNPITNAVVYVERVDGRGPSATPRTRACVRPSRRAATAPVGERGARGAGGVRGAGGTGVASSAGVASGSAAMAERAHRFQPHVLAIAAGTRVRFENHDGVYHNVFRVSPVKRFDSGRCRPGRARTITFERPGVVRVFCEIDPAMTGYVFVTPNPMFTQPDSTGAFELRGLPRGTYVVRVWHPTLGRVKRRVTLQGRNAEVQLRF
jgi:plastocyanin